MRVGHYSCAAGVISGSAPCVLDDVDPLPGLLRLHLSERQLEGYSF